MSWESEITESRSQSLIKANRCRGSFRVQSTGCERGGLLPPVHREARPDPVGWPQTHFFLLASLHCMGRERTRLRVRFALAPACLVYRSCELHCSAVISIEYEWSANPSDARCVSKFKMQIGKCGFDALRAPTETQGATWVHDEAARLSCHLCLLHFGDGSFEAL